MKQTKAILEQCPARCVSLRLAVERYEIPETRLDALRHVKDRQRAEIEQHKQFLNAVSAAVDTLDPLEREVVRLRYLESDSFRCQTWGEVCLKLYGSDNEAHKQAAYRLHNKALKALAPMLNKIEEQI